MKQASVTGVILSGGQGQRILGSDKGLAIYKSKPLIEHCIEALMPQVDNVLISCNRNFADYSNYGIELVADVREGFVGPLAGIEAVLQKTECDYVFICPVDTQPIPVDVVEVMLRYAIQEKAGIVYCGQPQKPQYLLAIIDVSLKQSLTYFLDAGDRKVRDWYTNHNAMACDKYEKVIFKNLNTPLDFK